MKKNTVILIIIILAVSFSILGARKLFFEKAGAVAVVSVGGVETGRYSLFEEQTVHITGVNGLGENTLMIKAGQADMTDADCPDKLCVHQRAASKQGETIVCLPHQVVVKIEAKEESKYDAIAD